MTIIILYNCLFTIFFLVFHFILVVIKILGLLLLFTPLEFFTSVLTDGFSLEFE